MKTKHYIISLFWLLISTSMFGQVGQEFCPGNYFDNGDLEIGTPTASHQDIDLAQGFSAIWANGSLADYYDAVTSPSGMSLPAPPEGDYAGFWVSNHPFSNKTWREGLYNTFLTPIAANTGNYTFNFDVACLYKDSGVNADVELGVYGIYNPSASFGVTPVTQFSPDNLNLFPGNTILLGTIPLNGDCSNIKQNYSINIATTGMTLTSITHIMITHSDTVISYADNGGKRYIGVDNFCLTIEEEGETDYCCDSDINEIKNGNFEGGDSGFTSTYSVGTSSLFGTVPGQYYVGTNADGLSISPLWNVNDHSACSIGSINDEVLFINGKTTQPPTTESVVYQQNIMLGSANEELSYKFCANFKNMPQATFDIIPMIDIRVNGVSQTGYLSLNNTTVTNPCSWELIDFVFTASGSVNIEIFLKEDGFGDGNDFAIDDISIQELQDPNYSITVQHQGNPQVITGSVNSIDPADDRLECESKDYCWYVVEVTNYGGGSISYDINTFASGNSMGSSSYIPSYMPCGTPWDLTTTYPCYPFAQDTLYMIGLYTPPNPECCLDEGWSYQLTFNHNRSGGVLSEDQKDEIRRMLKCGGNATGEEGDDSTEGRIDNSLVVYPNPASDILNIVSSKKIKAYSIFNYLGASIKTKGLQGVKLETINISNLENGVYILSIVNIDGTIKKTKFIKK